jgi:phage-related protein
VQFQKPRQDNATVKLHYGFLERSSPAVLIVEVFRKTTRATPMSVINTCKKRLSKMIEMHKVQAMDEAKKRQLEGKG